MAESNLEIKIIASGAKTLGEMRKEVANLKKEVLGLVPGTEDFAKKSAEVGKKQTEVNKALSLGWSEQAKLKDAYFKTGLEVRQLVLGSGLLQGELGKLSNSMGDSVLNAMQLRRALIPLGVSMSGIGVGAVAAISVLPSLVSWLTSTGDAAKKAKDQAKGLVSQLDKIRFGASGAAALRLSEKDPEKAVKFVDDRVKKLREAIEVEFDLNGKPILDAKQRNLDREKEINQLLDARIGILGNLLSAERKFESDQSRKFSPGSIMDTSPVGLPRMTLGGGRSSLFGSGGPRGLGTFKTELVAPLEQAQPKVSALTQTLASGATMFSRTLLDALIQGRNIAESIGYALLGFGLNLLTGGLGNVITGKDFLGGAASGGAVSLSSQRAAGGGAMAMPITVVNKVTPYGLATLVRQGNRIIASSSK